MAQSGPGGEAEREILEAESTPESSNERSRFIAPLDLSNGRVVISLADMVDVTNALKTNIDVEFITPNLQRIDSLPSRSPSPVRRECVISSRSAPEAAYSMGNAVHAVAGLQREVLLLRNELNFELWIQRENVKHVGRLYQDRILMKSAEAERQGLVRALSIRWFAVSEGTQCSTTNYASIAHGSSPLRANYATANNRQLLRRASMLNGTQSYSRD